MEKTQWIKTLLHIMGIWKTISIQVLLLWENGFLALLSNMIWKDEKQWEFGHRQINSVCSVILPAETPYLQSLGLPSQFPYTHPIWSFDAISLISCTLLSSYTVEDKVYRKLVKHWRNIKFLIPGHEVIKSVSKLVVPNWKCGLQIHAYPVIVICEVTWCTCFCHLLGTSC